MCIRDRACDVAIEDSSERVIDMMVQLLTHLTTSAVVTPNEFDKVCGCASSCLEYGTSSLT